MFRLINSHLQAFSLQVKSQDTVHTLGSQCVYISEIFKPYHLPRTVKRAKYITNWLWFSECEISGRVLMTDLYYLFVCYNTSGWKT
jgi:hypothetical protein